MPTNGNHQLGRGARWLCLFAAAALGAGLVFLASLRFERALATVVPWDLVVDQRMARAFLKGFNPYSDEGLIRSGLSAMGPVGSGHPPTSALWALAFAYANVTAAARVLGWALSVSFLASLWLVFRTLGTTAPAAFAWLTFGGVLASPFMTYHVEVGQLSALIATLVVVAWWAARRGQDAVAGVALGLACTVKLFPGVVLLLFL